MKKALICGVSGQDGAYLAQLLLSKGYEVWGTSRDAQMSSFRNLKTLGIFDEVNKVSMAINDFRSVLQALDQVKPDEVYNLSGQSSVGLSFEQPMETLESIATGTLNLLEVLRFMDSPAKLYNAGTSECFGETGDKPATETTSFHPRSPYAVAKAAAHWAVANYREAYNINACSGILYNHESPLRPERFVTKKIILAACRIANGSDEKLQLGNLSIKRDWGWAPEYVEAMWRMLQQDNVDDYIIATGHTYSLEEFVENAFSQLNLDWHDHVTTNQSLLRPSDIAVSRADPGKAEQELEWKAKYKMPDVIKFMIENELRTA